MKKFIVIVALLALVVAATAQVSKLYKAKGDLAARAEHELDLVDENSMNSVKGDLVSEAKRLGIDLRSDDIEISYKDTDIQSIAQKMVGNRLGAQYTNKQITINLHYGARVLGLPVQQTISSGKIRQVAAPVLPLNKAAQELLDSQP